MLVLNNTHPFSIARAFWLVRTHTLDARDAPAEHSWIVKFFNGGLISTSGEEGPKGIWAPRGSKSKIWGQNRTEIVKFLIEV